MPTIALTAVTVAGLYKQDPVEKGTVGLRA